MMELSSYFVKRVAAYTIDIFLASIFTTIVYFMLIPLMLIIPRGVIMDFANSRNLVVDYFILVILYYFIQELIWSKTVGKKIMGLVVVDVNMTKPNIIQIFIRNTVRVLDMVMIVGLTPIFFTKKQQRLGDMLSRTVVVENNANKTNGNEN